jgi:hypothetical protein
MDIGSKPQKKCSQPHVGGGTDKTPKVIIGHEPSILSNTVFYPELWKHDALR